VYSLLQEIINVLHRWRLLLILQLVVDFLFYLLGIPARNLSAWRKDIGREAITYVHFLWTDTAISGVGVEF
jgi:hypothetical protein